MRPIPVNGLALALTSFMIGAACTRADGRARESTPPAKGASLVAAHSGTAPDSLTAAADLGRIEGSPTAKVWLVEVSDLQCPFCKEWHDRTYPVIYDEYVRTGKIRFAYVNFPLPQHRNARPAATAAMCAAAQGKFWPVSGAIFSAQRAWEDMPDPRALFDSIAVRAGVNMAAYRQCLTAPGIQALIDADKTRAQRAGVGSTPTFLISAAGKSIPPIEGAVPASEMRKALDAALASAR